MAGLVLIFYLFTLGLEFRLPFSGYPWPLPFALLKTAFPIFNRITYCGRFEVMAHVFSALLFASALTAVHRRLAGRRLLRPTVMASLFPVILAVGALSLQGQLVPAPSAPYAATTLARYPVRAVIDVPLMWEMTATEGAWFQTYHGFPIMTGPGIDTDYVRPDGFKRLLAANLFLQRVSGSWDGIGPADPETVKRSIRDLVGMGFGYVIYHKEARAWYMDDKANEQRFNQSPPEMEDEGFMEGAPAGSASSRTNPVKSSRSLMACPWRRRKQAPNRERGSGRGRRPAPATSGTDRLPPQARPTWSSSLKNISAGQKSARTRRMSTSFLNSKK